MRDTTRTCGIVAVILGLGTLTPAVANTIYMTTVSPPSQIRAETLATNPKGSRAFDRR